MRKVANRKQRLRVKSTITERSVRVGSRVKPARERELESVCERPAQSSPVQSLSHVDSLRPREPQHASQLESVCERSAQSSPVAQSAGVGV